MARAEVADYSRDIQPLFAEHCLECHGPDASKGGLVLTTREGALKELKSGAHGVVPGDDTLQCHVVMDIHLHQVDV